MTPEDVQQTTFSTVRWSERGYRVLDVDDLLDEIAEALAGRRTLDRQRLMADLARSKWFEAGYRAEEVDAFRFRVCREFGF